MRIARLQHLLLTAIATGGTDLGTLASFNAGVGHILATNREATDAELLALENLVDQMVCREEEQTSGAGESVSLDQNAAPVPVAEGDASASAPEVTQEPAGEPAPSEPAFVPNPELDDFLAKRQAASETTNEAAANEPPVQEQPTDETSAPEHDEVGLTEVVGNPLPPPAGEAAHDEPAVHDEDDGA